MLNMYGSELFVCPREGSLQFSSIGLKRSLIAMLVPSSHHLRNEIFLRSIKSKDVAILMIRRHKSAVHVDSITTYVYALEFSLGKTPLPVSNDEQLKSISSNQ